MNLNLRSPVTLRTAQDLAQLRYRGKTELIWDRHNPQTIQGGKPTDPGLAWRLVPNKGHYDTSCCIAAPSRWQAARFLTKYTLGVLTRDKS